MTRGATDRSAPATRGATATSAKRCGAARVAKNAKTSAGYEIFRSAESPCGNPLAARANSLRLCVPAWTCATDASAHAARNLRRCDAIVHARSTNASRAEWSLCDDAVTPGTEYLPAPTATARRRNAASAPAATATCAASRSASVPTSGAAGSMIAFARFETRFETERPSVGSDVEATATQLAAPTPRDATHDANGYPSLDARAKRV
mmetsp:Transcript_6534/g.28747  ORF Transcript_6534/g.28747 Transcript_6534/m.28747 type:complete len:207 (+) Transcript_6534:281-901(+)